MRTVYFDCFAGIAGDMILGALVDAGLSLSSLEKKILKSGLAGFKLKKRKLTRKLITGTKVSVLVTKHKNSEISLREIFRQIKNLRLEKDVKEKVLRTFEIIGEAESKVHNIPVSHIHFHEVGAMDSVIDVIGSIIGLKMLGIEEIYCSALPVSHGYINIKHGNWPVPGPAVAFMMKDKPVYYVDVEGELVTPTGIGLMCALCREFGNFPEMRLEKVGYGAGDSEFDFVANFLRIFIGEKVDSNTSDSVWVLESNIDDSTPQMIGNAIEEMINAGALDAFAENIVMKKSRPAFKLSAIVEPEKITKIERVFFEETNTIGVRKYPVLRTKLIRKIKTVKTHYGDVKVKICLLDGKVINCSPEYESVREISKKKGVPFRKVYENIKNLTTNFKILN